jgi:hypothetical protein
MMMTLRGKKKSFHVGPDPFEQSFERSGGRTAIQFALRRKNPLGVIEIVEIARPLQDEIEAVDRNSRRRKEFRYRFETSGERSREMLQDGDGKNGVERTRRERVHVRPEIFPDNFHVRKKLDVALVIGRPVA